MELCLNSKEASMEVCRFCLKNASEFLIIDTTTREILELLVIKVDLNLSHQPIMCYDCANSIQRVFDFKSTIIAAEDNLLSFTDTKNSSKLNLDEIYCKINETESVGDLLVCRFCMELDKNDFCTSVNCLVKNAEMKNLLQKYFPEMVMEHIENPVICHNCLALLEVYSLFTKRHLKSEELIKSYMTATNNKLIDLKEVKNASENNAVPFKSVSAQFKAGKTPAQQTQRTNNQLKSPNSVSLFNKVQNSGPNNPEELLLKSGHTSCDNGPNSDVLHKPKSNTSDNNRCLRIAAKTDVSKNDKIVIEMEEVPYESIEATNLIGILAKSVTKQKLECEKNTEADNDTSPSSFHDDVKKEVNNNARDLIMKSKEFKCQICPLKCLSREEYQKHLATHDEKPFKCPSCAFKAARKCGLKMHMKCHEHPKLKMVQCRKCDYQTMYPTLLVTHMENIHETLCLNKKVYDCALCTFKSNCIAVYGLHVCNHKSVSGMLKCSQCEYETSKMCALKLHIRRHHM